MTWLVSYSAVLIVPILISLVIYMQANETLKSEIHRANDSLLKQMRYTIDTQVDLMERLNMEMTWSPNLQTLMYSNQPAKEAPYTAYQLVKELRLYKTSYASIDEFYVVWKKTNPFSVQAIFGICGRHFIPYITQVQCLSKRGGIKFWVQRRINSSFCRIRMQLRRSLPLRTLHVCLMI
ncbi:hypothetical protein MT997_22965 [Paenibacillus sp. OVF10]|nr:hypothetical protein MT997_22965 [Paenibacillus sp. OVF10]